MLPLAVHPTRLQDIVGGAWRWTLCEGAHLIRHFAATTAGSVTQSRQLAGRRVAIVGSGPAGVYCAKALRHAVRKEELEIDIYEKLHQPFGLARYGIAPDHTDMRRILHDFGSAIPQMDVVLHTKKEVTPAVLRWLRGQYHAVVMACGADFNRSSSSLGIPYEKDIPRGLFDAAEVVGWYMGHPSLSASPRAADLEAALLRGRGGRVVVVGNGNVALDIARVLSRPIEAFDMEVLSSRAAAALRETASKNPVVEVRILGRRSWLHTAATNAELRELSQLSDILATVDRKGLSATGKSSNMPRAQRRLKEILDKMPAINADTPDSGRCQVSLQFERRVVGCHPQDDNEGLYLESVAVEDTREGTVADLPARLLIKSIGIPTSDWTRFVAKGDTLIRDERGVPLKIEGERGRSPVFFVGWMRRGPRGNIADNIEDSHEVASLLLKYLFQ